MICFAFCINKSRGNQLPVDGCKINKEETVFFILDKLNTGTQSYPENTCSKFHVRLLGWSLATITVAAVGDNCGCVTLLSRFNASTWGWLTPINWLNEVQEGGKKKDAHLFLLTCCVRVHQIHLLQSLLPLKGKSNVKKNGVTCRERLHGKVFAERP